MSKIEDMDKDELIQNIIREWKEKYPYLSDVSPDPELGKVIDAEEFILVKEKSSSLNDYFYPAILNLLEKEDLNNLSKSLLKLREYFNQSYYGLNKEQLNNVKIILDEIYSQLSKNPNVITVTSIIKDLKNSLHEVIDKEIEKFHKEGKSLRTEITTGVISESFIKSKDIFSKRIKNQTCMFYILLVIISLISIFINGVIKIPYLIEKIKDLGLALPFSQSNLIEDIFIKVSIILPTIWAVLFISKRINEDKKLEQAYLHKQTVAQSFVTYLKFIKENNIQDADPETLKTLNRVMIESLGLNPALLLDKSTSEKIPMEELLSKILDRTIADKKS
ncbi:hypothetical protein [Gallibacterium anatis]|uniref:hypothetical protein n=1 Tax=Gallibacterium anatis TaxID=750 RepID=UPI0030066DC2